MTICFQNINKTIPKWYSDASSQSYIDPTHLKVNDTIANEHVCCYVQLMLCGSWW